MPYVITYLQTRPKKKSPLVPIGVFLFILFLVAVANDDSKKRASTPATPSSSLQSNPGIAPPPEPAATGDAGTDPPPTPLPTTPPGAKRSAADYRYHYDRSRNP